MEKKPSRPMTPFDEWTVPNELHTLKLLLPYTPAASQPALGILIKVIELQHTLEYFQHKKDFIHSQDFSGGFSSPLEMLEEISPYLPPEQANMIDTFRNMMNIMDMVQMMQAFSDTTGAPSTESNGSESAHSDKGPNEADSKDSSPKPGNFGGGFNPMNLVMGMLSPEQQEMFETYQNMFSQPQESGFESENFSDDSTLDAQDKTFSDNPTFETQDKTFSDNPTFETQDKTFSDNPTFEAQDKTFSDNPTFEAQDKTFSDDSVLKAQDSNFSDDFDLEAQSDNLSNDFDFETQNNDEHSYKERNGIDNE